MSRRDRDVIPLGATTPSQQTTNGSSDTVAEQFLKGQGPKAHLRLRSLVEMHQKMTPQNN